MGDLWLVWVLAAGFVGLAIGGLAAWLVVSGRAQRIREQLGVQIATLETEKQALNGRLQEMARWADQMNEAYRSVAQEATQFRVNNAALAAERDAQNEKIKWTEEQEEQMSNAFQALAAQVLRANSAEFLGDARAVIQPLDEALEKVEQQVREIEQKREGAYRELGEQLRQLGTTHTELLKTTTTLGQALRSPTVRGRWGEIELRRVVELAGMVNHVDFDEQMTMEAGRPDMVIRLPERGVIYVDAKATLEAYMDAANAQNDRERANKLAKHAEDLLSRAKQLGGKGYWKGETSPDLVVMFVPNEACLSAAFDCDATILDKAIEARVLITSPVTLLALLKAVAYGWQQVQIAENARRLYDEARQLYDRIGTFTDHVSTLGKNIQTAAESYNRAVGSFEGRIMPFARHFEELGATSTQLAAPPQIETATRRIAGMGAED